MSECPKTTRCKLCCKKLGTSHDVKIFAIGSFLKRFVVRIAKLSSLLKKQQTHSSNQHKINRFLVKFVQKVPTTSAIFYRFFSENLSENPAKFDFFPQAIRSPVVRGNPSDLIV